VEFLRTLTKVIRFTSIDDMAQSGKIFLKNGVSFFACWMVVVILKICTRERFW